MNNLNSIGKFSLQFYFEDEIFQITDSSTNRIFREEALMLSANYAVYFDLKSQDDTLYTLKSNFKDSILSYLLNFYEINSDKFRYWKSRIKEEPFLC